MRSCSSLVWFGENILLATPLAGAGGEGPFLELVSQRNIYLEKIVLTPHLITLLLTINYLNIRLRKVYFGFSVSAKMLLEWSEGCVSVPISVRLLEVGLAVLRVGDHRGLPGLPASRADLAVFVSELEGLDQSQGLVHIPTNGEVIDGHLSQLP